jgi:toxin ParE1/3/4
VARYRFSEDAKTDLTQILTTSLERWGASRQNRYQSLLTAATRELAVNPERAMSVDRGDLLPGLRSFHVRYMGRSHGVKSPVHVIYYRPLRASIIVLRVLHERMEAAAHFGGEDET